MSVAALAAPAVAASAVALPSRPRRVRRRVRVDGVAAPPRAGVGAPRALAVAPLASRRAWGAGAAARVEDGVAVSDAAWLFGAGPASRSRGRLRAAAVGRARRRWRHRRRCHAGATSAGAAAWALASRAAGRFVAEARWLRPRSRVGSASLSSASPRLCVAGRVERHVGVGVVESGARNRQSGRTIAAASVVGRLRRVVAGFVVGLASLEATSSGRGSHRGFDHLARLDGVAGRGRLLFDGFFSGSFPPGTHDLPP